MHKIMFSKIQLAQAKQKEFYDKFKKDLIEFKVGDSVKLINYTQKLNHSKAFTEKFLGPFKITQKLNDLIYVITNNNGYSDTVHYNRMMIWHDRSVKYNSALSNENNENVNEPSKTVDTENEFRPLIENQTSEKFISLIRRRRKKQNRTMPNFNNNEVVPNLNNEVDGRINDELNELVFGDTTNLDVSLARLNFGINEALNKLVTTVKLNEHTKLM